MTHSADFDAPTCQCVSLMDTSKCPVHGGNRWAVAAPNVQHCATCRCVIPPGVPPE